MGRGGKSWGGFGQERKGDGPPRREGSGSFTVESLFDYINESAASLAKVVATQREKIQNQQQQGEQRNDQGDMSPKTRKMSVQTSIRNKKGQRVRFISEVEIYPLPENEGKDAWMARKGSWGAAPESDRYWDGKNRRMWDAKKGEETVDAKTWLLGERSKNIKSFKEMLGPLFGSKRSMDEEDGEETNIDKLLPFETKHELEVEIELVEEGKSGKKLTAVPSSVEMEMEEEDDSSKKKRKNKSGKSRVDDVDQVYAANHKKAFEYSVPVKGDKESDELLKQDVLSKPLSPSQASVAASAGKVLWLKSNSGRTFGAAIRRKVNVKAEPKMVRPNVKGLKAASSSSSSGRRRKMTKQASDIRTPNSGLHMKPHYIFIFYILPLLLIGIDDMYPYFEHLMFVWMNPNTDIPVVPETKLHIPFYVRLLWPSIEKEKWLRNTYRFGSYVIEFSGLIVTLQLLYAWIVLFRAVRTKIRVRIDSIESDYSEFSEVSRNSMSGRRQSYAYLFKWQQAR